MSTSIDPLQAGSQGLIDASSAAHRAATDVMRATFEVPPANDNDPAQPAPTVVDGLLALGVARVGLFANAETVRRADEMLAEMMDVLK